MTYYKLKGEIMGFISVIRNDAVIEASIMVSQKGEINFKHIAWLAQNSDFSNLVFYCTFR